MENNKVKARNSIPKILISIAIIALVIFGVLRYVVPMDFIRLVSVQEQSSTKSMYVFGNLPEGDNTVEIQSDRIPEVLKVFSDYKYRRCIDAPLGGRMIRIQLLTNSARWSINIEVRDNGYITILNDKVYKILGEDKTAVFNKISRLLQ